MFTSSNCQQVCPNTFSVHEKESELKGVQFTKMINCATLKETNQLVVFVEVVLECQERTLNVSVLANSAHQILKEGSMHLIYWSQMSNSFLQLG